MTDNKATNTPALEAVASALFQIGKFNLASGSEAGWKIECDALTGHDWECLAMMAVEKLPPFGSVEGVPRGGIPFAKALEPHRTDGPLLIAEDVCTTGGSMDCHLAGRDAIGVCAFERGKAPDWVTPVWSLSQSGAGSTLSRIGRICRDADGMKESGLRELVKTIGGVAANDHR